MGLFIQLGTLEIEVRSTSASTLKVIGELFGYRASEKRQRDKKRLTCEIVHDSGLYRKTADRLDRNGPIVAVSPGIYLIYDFDGPFTHIYVHDTAIIKFDKRCIDHSNVILPEVPPGSTSSSETGLTPLPEAFFYPMMAEWIRNFGRCLMHCGAVELRGKAVMLTGPPGSGKSTHVLRLLQKGARFLADDLALLRRDAKSLMLEPFREVANVHMESINRFPELSRLRTGPQRGDGKYSIDIITFFNQQAVSGACAGTILRLHPDQESWLRPTDPARYLDGMHQMAFFAGQKEANIEHFELLSDFLWASAQWDVSQGYMAGHLDELVEMVSEDSK